MTTFTTNELKQTPVEAAILAEGCTAVDALPPVISAASALVQSGETT